MARCSAAFIRAANRPRVTTDSPPKGKSLGAERAKGRREKEKEFWFLNTMFSCLPPLPSALSAPLRLNTLHDLRLPVDSPDLAGRILDRLGRPSYTPVKPKVLAKRLDITSDGEYAEFRRVLRSLIRDGQVEVGRASTIQKVDAHGSAVGLFRRTGAGLAFVRPHLPSESTGRRDSGPRRRPFGRQPR